MERIGTDKRAWYLSSDEMPCCEKNVLPCRLRVTNLVSMSAFAIFRQLTRLAPFASTDELSRWRAAVQRHSERRTLMRSMEPARRAGSNEARHARSSTKTAARLSTSGSNGLTPNRKEPSSRDAAATPNSPTAHPSTATLDADAKTRRKMPALCDP